MAINSAEMFKEGSSSSFRGLLSKSNDDDTSLGWIMSTQHRILIISPKMINKTALKLRQYWNGYCFVLFFLFIFPLYLLAHIINIIFKKGFVFFCHPIYRRHHLVLFWPRPNQRPPHLIIVVSWPVGLSDTACRINKAEQPIHKTVSIIIIVVQEKTVSLSPQSKYKWRN